MDNNELIDIFTKSSSIKEASIAIFGKYNESKRIKTKKICEKIGFDWNKHLVKLKEENKKKCVCCGKDLEGKWQKRFCSKSCAATYNNSIKSNKKNVNRVVSKPLCHKTNESLCEIISFCKFCGNKLLNRQTDFCSNICRDKNREKEYFQYIEKWKNGLEDGTYSDYGIDKRVRKYLFDKFNNKCQKCGWGEVNIFTNRIPLQIHHIDGDCTNNVEDNLQLLCPNCHSLTNNFGSRNKDSKRIYRKQKLT